MAPFSVTSMSNRAQRPSFTMLGFEKSVKSSMSKSDQGPLKHREKWSVGCRKKCWDLVIFQKKIFFLSPKNFNGTRKTKNALGPPRTRKMMKKRYLRKCKKKFFGGATPILGGKYAPCPPILFLCWSILCLLPSCQTATPYLVPSAYTRP